MINKLKDAAWALVDTFAWKTDRKIVVFESDDWGSIRMPSKQVYNQCLKHGYKVDQNIFSKYDSLASEQDLNFLFNLLLNFKDINGNHPKITANCLVVNPDFDKIKENGYQNYQYELITETFKKYPKHSNCFDLWVKGYHEGVFIPQSHGREHLNVSRFMADLKANNPITHFAFDNEMPGIFDPAKLEEGNNYVVSLEYKDQQDEIEKCHVLSDGLVIFEKLFGYTSQTFIATNYIWSKKMEKTLLDGGIKALQGSRFQLIPKGNFKGFHKKIHYTGQKNSYKLTYMVRNSYFEPSLNPYKDWVNQTLAEIEKAFNKNLPAIISVHRINFVGFIESGNRDRSLKMLEALLKKLLKCWPNVEFMSSNQLYEVINNSQDSNF